MRTTLLIAWAILVSFNGLAASGGEPTVRCVDPDDGGCFTTIQSAVDASAAGDSVEVRLPADGRPYLESVAVAVPDLTIYGAEPVTFDIDTFEELLAVDFDAERALCPPVLVDPCDSSDCGVGPTFDIRASGVTVQRLTTRFPEAFLRLEGPVDGVTLEDSCLIKGDKFIETVATEAGEPSGLTVSRNRVYSVFRGSTIRGDGLRFEWNLLRRHDGLDIIGDNVVLQGNYQFLTEDGDGLYVIGDGTRMLENISRKTTGYGFRLEGDNVTVSGNLVEGVAPRSLHAAGIRIAAVGAAAGDPESVPASNATVTGNTVRNTFGAGLTLEADDSAVTQNVFESTGSPHIRQPRRAASIEVLGSRNQVQNNTVRSGGGVGLVVGGGPFATDNNLLAGNSVENSAKSGFVITAGTRTTVQNNTAIGGGGEGFGQFAAASHTAFTGNMLSGNRTDMCSCGSFRDLSGNTFATGGRFRACVVERGAVEEDCPQVLFADDFESGDLSAWSSVVP
ncbi:MAG: right-handed parallel beta-helix repeat-containing protein [Acidobacteriota bacterium]